MSGNNLSPSDIQILHEFYNATDGENWNIPSYQQPWVFNNESNPCSPVWYGLGCTSIGGEYKVLTTFQFDYIDLFGTIPESFYNFTSLKYFFIVHSGLYGTLSKKIGQLQSLSELSLEGCNFSGTLPVELSTLAALETLSLDHNNFEGTVAQAFNGEVQTLLSWVNLGSNVFTGTIPSTIADLPALIELTLSWNCFHGTIPDALCDRDLNYLILTGANAANSCLTPFISFQGAQSYLLKHPMTGTIPSCLLELPHISEIQMDKLGIATTLPKPSTIGPALRMLNLNNNAIYGSIPSIIQNHRFDDLDLSSNKISGVLSHNFSLDGSVYLDYNRMSSVVPPHLINNEEYNFGSNTVEILEGNMFACLPDRSDLPRSDPYYPKYQQCGSTGFNNTLYGAIGVVVGSLLVVLVLYFVKHKLSAVQRFVVRSQIFMSSYSEVMRDTSYHRWMDFVRRWVCVLTSVILVFFIPLYIALSAYYATQTYKYAWVVSGVYLNGVVSTVMIILLPIALAATVYYPMVKSEVDFVREKETFSFNKCWSFSKALWLFLVSIIVLGNIIFVVIVNTSYIAIVRIANESVAQRASIAMSIFKIVWNYLIVRNVLKYLTFKSPIPEFEVQQFWFTRLETSMVLFNNIIAPYVATLLVSANCLQNAFLRTTNAAFMYSYQCGSTFITTYTSVFLFMFALTAVGFPLIQGFLMWMHFQVYPRKKSSTFYAYWEKMFAILQPKLLFPEIEVEDACPELQNMVGADPQQEVDTRSRRRFLEKRLFCADLLVVDMVSMFAIMLTFGAIVPAVAFVGCAAILSVTLFNELMIGRGITKVNETYDKEPSKINKFRLELKLECKSFSELFKVNLFVVMPFVAIFYGLLVFDMLGDTEGAVKAVWAPLIVLVVIVAITFFGKYFKVRTGDLARESMVPLLREDNSVHSEL